MLARCAHRTKEDSALQPSEAQHVDLKHAAKRRADPPSHAVQPGKSPPLTFVLRPIAEPDRLFDGPTRSQFSISRTLRMLQISREPRNGCRKLRHRMYNGDTVSNTNLAAGKWSASLPKSVWSCCSEKKNSTPRR